MKKLFALLFALLMLLSLTACGGGEEPAEEGGDQSLTRGGAPEEQPAAGESEETVLDPDDLDLDLSICQPEEAYREIEHFNTDPRGYVGLRLRVTGEISHYVSHNKTFYYIGVRSDDGIANLELRFPGDGRVPEGFPEDGSVITVWGRLGTYSTQRGDEDVLNAVLTDVQFTTRTEFRD